MKRSRLSAACLAACAAAALQFSTFAQTQPSQPGVPPDRPDRPTQQPPTRPDRDERVQDRDPNRDPGRMTKTNEGDPLDIAALLREKNFKLTNAIQTAEKEADGIAVSARTRMVPSFELRSTPDRDSNRDDMPDDTRPGATRNDQRIPAAIVCVVDRNDQINFVTVDLTNGKVVNIRQGSLGEMDNYDFRPGTRTGATPGATIGSAVVLKGNELIGRDVVNSQGEKLGEINDLAVDPDSGRIAYAVLGSGGVLGVGDKLYAIPWQALSRHHSDDGCLLDVDKERLQNAPGFDSDKWPNMADQRWATDVHTFYKTDASDFKPRRIVKATDVMGTDVHNTQDEDIGEINNLAIDGRQGRVQYAVLSFGGVLGIGNKLFAVPWDALRLNADGDKYIIAIDKERLQNAPGFDQDDWPDMANEQFTRQIRDFYGPGTGTDRNRDTDRDLDRDPNR